MPIKFRCNHCRQLLGISRAKAGEVVDCPTCGRSVRVPELDGRRALVPEPELDLNDSRLVGALDQLAQIGREPDENQQATPVPEQNPEAPQIIAPQPLPDPIPIEPPPPVQPVVAAGTVGGVLLESRRLATRSMSSGDALAELPRGVTGNTNAKHLDATTVRRRWTLMFPPPVILTLLGVACAGIAFGFLIGRQGGAERSSSVPAKSGNGSPQKLAASGAASSNAATAVKGRITYKNDEGDSRPDRKARVLIFPQQRDGQRKLDITGFRGGDAAEDFRSAAVAFRALGGGVAVVNDDGSFEISLPVAGTYHVLVLSNYQPRETDETIDGPLMNLLAKYFDRPEQLLGRVAYHFGQMRYKGGEPVLWDHSF